MGLFIWIANMKKVYLILFLNSPCKKNGKRNDYIKCSIVQFVCYADCAIVWTYYAITTALLLHLPTEIHVHVKFLGNVARWNSIHFFRFVSYFQTCNLGMRTVLFLMKLSFYLVRLLNDMDVKQLQLHPHMNVNRLLYKTSWFLLISMSELHFHLQIAKYNDRICVDFFFI